MVLQAALHSSVDCSALDLSDLHLEGPLEVAGGDEGEGGGGVPGPGVNVEVVASVPTADDRDWSSSRHHEPERSDRGREERPTDLSDVHW